MSICIPEYPPGWMKEQMEKAEAEMKMYPPWWFHLDEAPE